MPLIDWHRNWESKRARLERELRVLIVDGDAAARKQLDDLLFRLRVPARSVSSAEHALQVAERDRTSLVISADVLPGMHGMTLLRTLRDQLPSVDLVLTARSPSVRSLAQAFELNLLDVWEKPFDGDELGERIRCAVRRHTDRKMRAYVLDELRGALANLDTELKEAATSELEARLSIYKRALGAFDRVLVVEGGDTNLRLLSEHLMLVGLRVETADTMDAAFERLKSRAINLLIADGATGRALPTLLERVGSSTAEPELLLVARKPSAVDAQGALRARAAAYVPWPPTSLSHLAERARELLRSGRRERLIDNLFVELYCETARATGARPEERFEEFRQLIGLERVVTADDVEPKAGGSSDPADYLNEVLTGMLDDLGRSKRATPPSQKGERRGHERVAQSQFLRFRLEGHATATMAYLGDLSVGGIFVRTNATPRRDHRVEIDFNVEHRGQHYRVQSEGVVAWLARSTTDSPHGAGFGVRFIDPADDVIELMEEIASDSRQ